MSLHSGPTRGFNNCATEKNVSPRHIDIVLENDESRDWKVVRVFAPSAVIVAARPGTCHS